MIEEDSNGAIEMLKAGVRALRFQEFLSRRSWGLFYGIWAIDILINLIGSIVLGSAESSILSTIAIVSGFWVSTNVFGKSRRVSRYMHYINGKAGRTSENKIVRIFLYLLIIYVIAFAFTLLEIPHQKIDAYISDTAFVILIFAASTSCFYANLKGLGKLTIENLISSASLFVVGIIEVSIPTALYLGMHTLTSIIVISWSVVIALWMTSSLISFYRSSEILGGPDGEN